VVEVEGRVGDQTAARASWVRLLLALTVLHALNDFYGLLLPPLLPALREALNLSYTQLGVIPFVGTAVSSLLQPTLGYLADRRRTRRASLIAGFGGYIVAMVWLSGANSYALVLVGAAILGVASSTYHPQSATYIVHGFPSNRGFAMGIHGLGNTAGFLAAPIVITMLLPTIGLSQTLLVLALPAAIAIVLCAIAIKEPAERGAHGMFAGITGPVVLLTIVHGVGGAAALGFLTWLPSYYGYLEYSLPQAGLLTAVMVASGAIAQPLGGVISDRLSRRSVLIAALVGVALFQGAFVFTTWLPAMIVLSIAAGFAGAFLGPVVLAYAGELARGGRTGTSVGFVWGIGISVASLAPLVSGAMIDAYGFGVSYLALAALAVFAAALGLRLPRS